VIESLIQQSLEQMYQISLSLEYFFSKNIWKLV